MKIYTGKIEQVLYEPGIGNKINNKHYRFLRHMCTDGSGVWESLFAGIYESNSKEHQLLESEYQKAKETALLNSQL